MASERFALKNNAKRENHKNCQLLRRFKIDAVHFMLMAKCYVSQDYALSFYSIIPERVHVVTSMTTGRRKYFRTPVGEFSYEPLASTRYALGIRR